MGNARTSTERRDSSVRTEAEAQVTVIMQWRTAAGFRILGSGPNAK